MNSKRTSSPKKNLAAAAANLDDPVFSEFKSRLSDFGCSSRGTVFLESTNPRRTFSQKNSTIPQRTFSQKKLNAAAGNLDDPVFSEQVPALRWLIPRGRFSVLRKKIHACRKHKNRPRRLTPDPTLHHFRELTRAVRSLVCACRLSDGSSRGSDFLE